MAQERDMRPLAEIRFAQDRPEDEVEVRNVLRSVGVAIGQDIVELGCTGLALRLCDNYAADVIGSDDFRLRARIRAEFVRKRMSGSICGLPCYVPRDRYCLVHDTIGGLQEAGNLDGPQAQRYPEALPFMSRELTPEEAKKVGGVQAKLAGDVIAEARAQYNAEPIDEGDDLNFGSSTPAPSCPIPQPPFKCPEHTEPNWECRKCSAQAVAESRGDMRTTVRVYVANVDVTGRRNSIQASLDEALEELAAGDGMPVELWVRVASWSKKVTRD